MTPDQMILCWWAAPLACWAWWSEAACLWVCWW
jgi:hypothetical protein